MKRATTLLAIVAVWAAVLAAPVTANDHVTWDEGSFDWVYENTDAELVLVSGPPFEEGCLGEGFTVAQRQSILIDGVYSSRMSAGNVTIRLFSVPSIDDLFNEACGAVFGGGDVPQPIATGIGSWTYRAENQSFLPASSFDQPAVGAHITNSATAIMEFTDGTSAEVRGIVDFVVTDQGLDISILDVQIRPAG